MPFAKSAIPEVFIWLAFFLQTAKLFVSNVIDLDVKFTAFGRPSRVRRGLPCYPRCSSA